MTTDRSEYAHNLRVACVQSEATPRTYGLLASAIAGHARHVERIEAEKRGAETAVSEHFGELKKRYELGVLTVTMVRHLESDYGVTTMIVRQADVIVGQVYFTRVSGNFQRVRVTRRVTYIDVVHAPQRRNKTRFYCESLETGKELPKPRSAAALRPE